MRCLPMIRMLASQGPLANYFSNIGQRDRPQEVIDRKLPGATYHAAATRWSEQVDFSGALTYPFSCSNNEWLLNRNSDRA